MPTNDLNRVFFQRRLFVHCNMVTFIAFDFVLRIFHRGVVRVSFVIDVSYVHLNDPTRVVPGLDVPAHIIVDFEFMGPWSFPMKVQSCKAAVSVSARNGGGYVICASSTWANAVRTCGLRVFGPIISSTEYHVLVRNRNAVDDRTLGNKSSVRITAQARELHSPIASAR